MTSNTYLPTFHLTLLRVSPSRERVREASRRLQGAAAQRIEIQARARAGAPVHVLDCDVDVRGLEAYLEGNGEKTMGARSRQTQRQW